MFERRKSNIEGPRHFLGAVVLDLHHTYGNEIPAHIIIDGQQRLTSFQLLLAALRDAAITLNVRKYGDEVDRYVLNTGIMDNEEEEQFKVWPSRPDQPSFCAAVKPKSSKNIKKQSEYSTSLVTQAYKFFYQKINALVSDGDGGTTEQNVEFLYQALRDDLEVVSIELEGDDDPQIIFESLNARGEPLLPSDLLRNFIFWRATKSSENKDQLYEAYWSPFDTKFWKEKERVGRLKRHRVDIFFQHFLESKKCDGINVARLYQEYRSWISENNPFDSVGSELQTLNTSSKIYR